MVFHKEIISELLRFVKIAHIFLRSKNPAQSFSASGLSFRIS